MTYRFFVGEKEYKKLPEDVKEKISDKLAKGLGYEREDKENEQNS